MGINSLPGTIISTLFLYSLSVQVCTVLDIPLQNVTLLDNIHICTVSLHCSTDRYGAYLVGMETGLFS